MSAYWSRPTSPDIVARRAGGRNRYNAQRRTARMLRRIMVAELVARHGGLSRGNRAAIARELEVSEATVSRDVARHRTHLEAQNNDGRCEGRNSSTGNYESGHMVYIDQAASAKYHADLVKFVQGAVPK